MTDREIMKRFNLLQELTDILFKVSENLATTNDTDEEKELLKIIADLSGVLYDFLHYQEDK
jgi:hypothetical protein